MKRCTRCGEVKPLAEFGCRGGVAGAMARCKPCQVRAVMDSRARHPETVGAWRRTHRLEINARARARKRELRQVAQQAEAAE